MSWIDIAIPLLVGVAGFAVGWTLKWWIKRKENRNGS